MTKRVGLYLRVSTKNGQTVDGQRQVLELPSAVRFIRDGRAPLAGRGLILVRIEEHVR
jgi:hypothetical protein